MYLYITDQLNRPFHFVVPFIFFNLEVNISKYQKDSLRLIKAVHVRVWGTRAWHLIYHSEYVSWLLQWERHQEDL